VAGVCKAFYFHIRNISSSKSILTHDALIYVVHPFITSQLDYCNSLLLGLSDKLFQRLQRIQFKTLMIIYKALNGLAPIYLTSS